MPHEPNTSGQGETSVANESTRHLEARRLYRLGIIVAVFGLLSGPLFYFAPRYLARYLVAAELDALGISHEGVEPPISTLGPVSCGSAPCVSGSGRRIADSWENSASGSASIPF
jgi:hypothetical protein